MSIIHEILNRLSGVAEIKVELDYLKRDTAFMLHLVNQHEQRLIRLEIKNDIPPPPLNSLPPTSE